MSQSTESEKREKQLNVGLVDETLVAKIDELWLKLNAAMRRLGHDGVPKKELYPAAILKYLSSWLAWIGAKETVRQEILIEKFTDELKEILKGAIIREPQQ